MIGDGIRGKWLWKLMMRLNREFLNGKSEIYCFDNNGKKYDMKNYDEDFNDKKMDKELVDMIFDEEKNRIILVY